MLTEQRCPCGQPLHYQYPETQRIMEELIEHQGTHVRVVYRGTVYWVSRHYLALHGLIAKELPQLHEQGLVGLAP